MKIGIRANTAANQGYGRYGENAYKKLKEHGFSCSDFNMIDTESEVYRWNEEKFYFERELAEKAGIEIVQVHGPWCWPARETTAEGAKERMEKMKKSIYCTHLLGCKYWVIHPLLPFGRDDINAGKKDETWEFNKKFFSELLCTAKKYDVTICIENMPFNKFSLATPANLLEFVNEINDENFKICLDTGHVEALGMNVADETRRLGNKIKVLHVHDSMPGEDLHLMPYYGEICWIEFAKALRDINYSGCFSLETMPPATLPDEMFENACKKLYKVSKEICEMN